MIRNLHFYNSAEKIKYPLDDTVSARDDAGVYLPPDVLVDANLRWPETSGRFIFLTALSVTDGLVTLTFQATNELDASSGFTPLAVVSIPQPVRRWRMYPIQAQTAGVGGWVVFGSGIKERRYRGRFSSPLQSRLTPRAARSYRPLPISSLGVYGNATPLTGVIDLVAKRPLALAKEQREIAGVLRDVIVVRLVDDLGVEGLATPAVAARAVASEQHSVFERFAGPCAGRPEARTCGAPAPIEFINSVGPDCNGVVTIEFKGCADVASMSDGVAISCDLGLTDACLAERIPSTTGTLPNDVPGVVITPPAESSASSQTPVSESCFSADDLPYIECFVDGVPANFLVKVGTWQAVSGGDSPDTACSVSPSASSQSISAYAYGATAAYSRNVAVWNGLTGDLTLCRRVVVDLALRADVAAAQHNGGVVLNYREDTEVPGRDVYHMAEIDWEAQELRLRRFNGTRFVDIAAVTVAGLSLEHWYRLIVDVTLGGAAGQVEITASLTSLTAPDSVAAVVQATVTNYAPSTGQFGIGTNRALTRFGTFQVDAV